MVKNIFVVCVHDGDGNMIPSIASANSVRAHIEAANIWEEHKKGQHEADFDEEIEVHEVELVE